jgi:hypothetical protein
MEMGKKFVKTSLNMEMGKKFVKTSLLKKFFGLLFENVKILFHFNFKNFWIFFELLFVFENKYDLQK